MKKQIIIALATLTALPAVSQEKWDLRKCIDYAIEHNLSIKQQEAARDQNAVDLNTAKYSRLPNLNGNVGQSFNFGRALQADNTYGDRNTKNTNFSLSTSIPLFTGLRIPNNIALSKLNLKAAIEDLNKAKEDISISVTSAYLQILFNEELAKVAHNQVELSREQLEFAHMVIFSQAHQASLGGLASQCILTEVICSGEAAGYDQQDGIAILGGTPENLPETLSYLEI